MTESPLKSGSKYFLHGIAFSILYLALAFVWVILLVVLVIVGFFIGLIVGLVLLFRSSSCCYCEVTVTLT